MCHGCFNVFVLGWNKTFNFSFICQLCGQSQRNVISSSVNGDIAFLWELSKFDPPQNPNPLTDYDKTLQNWLRPWDVINFRKPKLVQIGRKGASGQIREIYKACSSLFFFIFIFPQTGLGLLQWLLGRFWRTVAQITRNHARMCFFEVRTMNHI